jgi:hypothetical protein
MHNLAFERSATINRTLHISCHRFGSLQPNRVGKRNPPEPDRRLADHANDRKLVGEAFRRGTGVTTKGRA